jgi:hypothetical protein
MVDTQYTSGFEAGKDYGRKHERMRWEDWLTRIRTWTIKKSTDYREGALHAQYRTLEAMRRYFELTQMPDDDGVVENNPAWDSGYQAAMAIVQNSYNHESVLDTQTNK